MSADKHLVTTLEQLKAVETNGIFYLNAHGGKGFLRADNKPGDNRNVFCIWTGTPANDCL